jgi:hypothetical protein
MACSHPGVSNPESLRGNDVSPTRAPRVLPSVLPFDAPVQASLGFHRFEPVIGIVSPLPWAMLLTRQGISLIDVVDLLVLLFKSPVEFSLEPNPACRHADRTISSPAGASVWRLVSEDSGTRYQSFLLIFRTTRIFTAARCRRRVPCGYNGFSSIWPNFTKATILETLGPFWSLHNTQNQRVCGVLHCALLLHVAMQFGLSHLFEKRAWRIVSEDSGARLRRHRPVFPAD